MVQFSFRPPNADYLGFEATPGGIIETACKAEELGLDALLVNAHIISRSKGRLDLWHRRLETGMDCRLLEREEMLPEWRPRLWSPLRSDGSSLISEAVRDFYQQTDSAADIRRGWESLDRWIGRLPWILLWTGSTCPPRFRYSAGVVGAAVNPVSRLVLGRLLQPFATLEDTVSIASPWSPEPLFTKRVLRAAEEVLERFGPSWEQQVARMKNMDLDTGEPARRRGVPDEH